MEVLFGQAVHIFAKAVLEFRQSVGGQGHAHRSLMPTETGKDIGAALDRLEQVDVAHAAPRTPCLPVFVDGEQDDRHAVRTHQPACDDTLHALVPAIAGNHQSPLARVGFNRLLHRDLHQFGLDGAPAVVDTLQFLRLIGRFPEIIGKQQVQGYLGIAHAARGIEARDDAEGKRYRGNGLVQNACAAQKRRDAGPGRLVHARDAVCDERTVVALHGHEVGNGAQGCKVGVFAPEMGLPETGAERLDDLQCHADARKDGLR